MSEKTITLLNHQADFLESDAKFAALVGGIGSGKTWSGSHFAIMQAGLDNTALGFIGANTYSQLEQSTLASLFNELTSLEIPYKYNQNKGILEFYGAKILCKSMENYEMLRGIEVGWFWLDEVRDLKQQAFDMMMGRLRDKKAKRLKGRVTSSPAGFNWVYDYFHANGERNTSEFKLIHATSHDNIYLPEGYIDSIKAQYSEEFYKQEILGEFVNIYQGQAYTQFSQKNVVTDNPLSTEAVHPMLPIIVGLDFNVGHMAWTLCQKRVEEYYVLDEIYIKNTHTQEAAKVLIAKLIEIHPKIKKVGVILAGDASGAANKTSAAGQTDYDLLCMALDEAGIPWTNVTPDSNPSVKDRVNTVNAKLKDASGSISLWINAKCKNLIRDFERVAWKEGASNAILDQVKDPSLTHLSDSVGYVLMALSPLRVNSNSTTLRVVRR